MSITHSVSRLTALVAVSVLLQGTAWAAECAQDADCDDGLFCTGVESCIDGACAALSACPPSIEGCIIHGAGCDEDADTCVDARLPLCDDTCRTAGFWGSHGGTEKGGTDVTNTVLSACGCVSVCGEVIDNTDLNDASSAIEAMCVSPSGDPKLQLARQLTALALNCCSSGFGGDCADDPALSQLLAECNDICLGSDAAAILECTFRVDCYNNGGQVLENGDLFCQTGTCQVATDIAEGSGEPCNSSTICPTFETSPDVFVAQKCVRLDGNCQAEKLCNEDDGYCYTKTPAASSSTKCNTAAKPVGGTKKAPLHCTILPPGEQNCATGLAEADFECCADAACDDGLFCTGAEQCVENGCAAVSACPPAIIGCAEFGTSCDEDADTCGFTLHDEQCDDADPCTTDTCDITGICLHEPIIGCAN